ncbi:MAG: CBS domain-containing protein [Coriobacteriia bacterium]|nr:CBS domain-containing protein [Coriobacteriia bacterium]
MQQMAYDPAEELLEDGRALDRLASVAVHEVMRSPAAVFVGAEHMSLREAAGRRRFIYVIERDGRLVGWLDTSELQPGQSAHDLTTHADPGTVSVTPDDTLDVALDRMLTLGFRAISVTDDRHRLVGEVTMMTIEDAAAVEEAT